MVLPGIIPRLRAFARDGFGWLAFLMALTYQGARLLPASHPYCNPANKGRFGIRHVMAEAANHLVISWKHIDQILVFVAMLAGFVILAAQVILLLGSFLIKTAFATPAPFAGMFNTAAPETDIALTMLAHVFGVPRVFCNNAGTACTAVETTLPTPFHDGLHALLHFYNLAILLVGVLILVYYIIVVVAETAHTGTPFGRRFSHIWAPMRLVVAVGLLIPLNYGLNSAQYMTLFAARMGSGFATNGWLVFNEGLSNATGLENAAMIARTTAPDVQYLMKFMMLVNSCRYGYFRATGNGAGGARPESQPIPIRPYFARGGNAQEITSGDGPTVWEEGNNFYDNNDIIIRFGHQSTTLYPNEEGGVKPFCGEVVIHRVDPTFDMGRQMAERYTQIVLMLWNMPSYQAFGRRAAEIYRTVEPTNLCIAEAQLPGGTPCGVLPAHDYKQQQAGNLQSNIETQVTSTWTANVGADGTMYEMPVELLNRGWGGAGIWYNRIAQWNGAWIEAVKNVPSPSKMPSVMQDVQSARQSIAARSDRIDRYNPSVNGDMITFERPEDEYMSKMLFNVYRYWEMDSATESTDVRDSNSPVLNLINAIFGIDGIFTIRQNHDIHPLAQLVALGKGIIDAAVRNLTIAIGSAAIAGGADGVMGKSTAVGGTFGGISSAFTAFATMGMTVGFILFYVLPFMPFMYFFFAVGTWVKSVFEAMVGVPLWALAHLRIDGNGLPGEAALNGYFLLFEIFIRPILTVFGLLGSLVVFTAMVRVLHEIFPLVTQNMTGFDATQDTTVPGLLYTSLLDDMGMEFKRDPIDEFFFTIIYTVIVYMLATSCFKMIDQVPNGILRWMGAGVQTFSDRGDEAVGGLVQHAAISGQMIGGQVTGVMTQGAQGAGQVAGTTLGSLLGRNRGLTRALGQSE